MARSSREVIEKTKLCTLRYFADRAQESRGRFVCASLRTIAADLDLSVGRVVNARRHLLEEDLVRMEHRLAENGGTIENAYWVTKHGRALLDRVDAHARQADGGGYDASE